MPEFDRKRYIEKEPLTFFREWLSLGLAVLRSLSAISGSSGGGVDRGDVVRQGAKKRPRAIDSGTLCGSPSAAALWVAFFRGAEDHENGK